MNAENAESRPTSSLDDRLQAEIEAALGDMSLDDLMRDDSASERPSRGGGKREAEGGEQRPVRFGTVVSVHGGDVLVEFDPKTQGVCSSALFKEEPKPGEKLEFILDKFNEDEKLWMLSRRGEVQKAEWESLEVGQVVEARCTGVNKGGLELEVANHRAFMPAGQVDIRHIKELEVFIGEKMTCEVIELDRQRGRIILSRKAFQGAERRQLRDKLLNELQPGDVRPATIVSVQAYGAFADLGGVDGLIHISDLSYERIKHPSEVVKEGDQVEVKILKIEGSRDDESKLRIALGLKQLMTDPFESSMGAIQEGERVSGRVTKIMPFGAFVEIAPGVEGLIHISELAHERVHKVTQVVKPDQIVSVMVLSVDPASKRISLSLKATQDAPGSEGGGGPGGSGGGGSLRKEDAEMRKLKAQLSAKFGENLKGGIG